MSSINVPYYSRRIQIILAKPSNAYTRHGVTFNTIIKLPAIMKADKVYLITNCQKYVSNFIDATQTRISESRKVDFEVIRGSYTEDLYYAIGILRRIIESERGNQIFINLPYSSHIWIAAGIIATMLFSDDDKKTEIIPYYLTVDSEVRTIPIEFGIQKPSEEILDALSALAEIKNTGDKITKTVLIKSLIGKGCKLPDESSPTAATHNMVQRKYLDPLMELGYIVSSGSDRRKEYSITEKGMNALHSLKE